MYQNTNISIGAMHLLWPFLFSSMTINIMAQADSYLQLFEDANARGESRIVKKETLSLALIGFKGKASSYCINDAIFIMYSEHSFNTHTISGGSMWVWSKGLHCANMEERFDNKASSARPAGDPSDYRKSSINLYSQEGFEGKAELYTNDTPSVKYHRAAKSIIITGSDPWTLYAYESYMGDSVCIYPSANYMPGIYPRKIDLGVFANKVTSVAKGCLEDPKEPQVIIEVKEVNFTMGSFNV